MWCDYRALLLLPLLTAPPAKAACQCIIRFGVCDEARQSQAVFIGTVESVSPPLLDPYGGGKTMASLTSGEAARLQADPSPEALAKLKEIYLNLLTGIPDRSRQQISDAQTQADLEKAFETVRSQGRVAHFQVKTLYRLQNDDDDASAAATPAAAPQDDDTPPKSLDVWTSAGDCGVNFEVGETYLVYAIEDEDSGRLETSTCMRTRRLSDEGGDLAFLYFLKNGGAASTRLEGFVSTSFADQNVPRYEDQIAEPSPAGALLELDDGGHPRYSQSNGEGRFVFDGLKAGDYRLSLLAPGYPQTPRTVILSRPFHAAANACVRQIFVDPVKPSSP